MLPSHIKKFNDRTMKTNKNKPNYKTRTRLIKCSIKLLDCQYYFYSNPCWQREWKIPPPHPPTTTLIAIFPQLPMPKRHQKCKFMHKIIYTNLCFLAFQLARIMFEGGRRARGKGIEGYEYLLKTILCSFNVLLRFGWSQTSLERYSK